jgi:DNA excision repair protein ERCC-2
MLGTYGLTKSFAIVFEPFDDRLPNIPDPVLQLACLDASLAMKPVFTRFHTVVLTSGTISPMNLYAKILGFRPVITKSLSMSLQRRAICPIVVSRGPDQVAISSKYDCRSDTAVARNYGGLVIEFAGVVPDGIVVFFPSYVYMEHIISMWHDMGLINRMVERKLVFIETPDSVESALALDRYRSACDTGRGAIFLCVARGKVAEGIDFDRHYGRAVIVIGVPFQYTESRILRARLEYMRSTLDIREGDYLSFDAMRQTAQCIGRVVRSKTDYGVAVLADKRFVRADKKNKLPQWILELMLDSHVDLDTQAAASVTSLYLRQMAQPVAPGSDRGTALLTEEDVKGMSQRRNGVE